MISEGVECDGGLVRLSSVWAAVGRTMTGSIIG